jgi:hypothetical protein
MIAEAGTRVLVALRTESLMLIRLRFVDPNGAWPVSEGCGIRRRMAVNGEDIDGYRSEDRCVFMRNPGKCKCVVTREWLVAGSPLGRYGSCVGWGGNASRVRCSPRGSGIVEGRD